MASVNVTAVQVGNNPAKLTDGFSFEVTFECVAPLTAGESRGEAGKLGRRLPQTATPAAASLPSHMSHPPGNPIHTHICADLEWRVIYVGSAASPDYDQELDSAIVGPVPIGTCKFALNVGHAYSAISWGEGRGWGCQLAAAGQARWTHKHWAGLLCLALLYYVLCPIPFAHAYLLTLQTSPPDATKIPEEDLIGATCVLITGSYKSHEFIRIGYWVANTYAGVLQEGEWGRVGSIGDADARRHETGGGAPPPARINWLPSHPLFSLFCCTISLLPTPCRSRAS